MNNLCFIDSPNELRKKSLSDGRTLMHALASSQAFEIEDVPSFIKRKNEDN